MDVHNKNQILNQYISRLQTEFILIDHGLCPDWTRDTHRRRRDTVYLILDGRGEITIDGQTIYPVKGNMVLLPRGSLVSFKADNADCYNKYWCEFNMHIDEVSLFKLIDFPHMIELCDTEYAKNILDRLDDLHTREDVVSAIRIKSLLLELIALFLDNDTREKVNRIEENYFVTDMKEYIKNHLGEKITVKALADKTRYNEKYFISLFKNNFGVTPARYIKTLRLDEAKRLLLYTDDKSARIINEIGYPNIQMFSKDFKEYTGFSPTAFRKTFK